MQVELAMADAIEEYRFADDGAAPNNPILPLLVYRRALASGDDSADACAALFARNGWPGAWRNGIYAHHHFHSTAHEVLGFAAGAARVRFGGEHGRSVAVAAGDVVVIPAGVAHKCEEKSADLLVVGAYPRGQRPDLLQPDPRSHARAVAAIAAVPLPGLGPVFGAGGPLARRWRAAAGYRQRPL
jgi:uncharacterized protein YjlB